MIEAASRRSRARCAQAVAVDPTRARRAFDEGRAVSAQRATDRGRRLRDGQPALGREGARAHRARGRASRATTTRSARPTASSCPASARSRRRCATCASSGSTPCSASGSRRGVPMLGICLGMQLLFESLERERGQPRAWACSQGRVERLPAPGLKVPLIGWNAGSLGAGARRSPRACRTSARSTSCTRSRRSGRRRTTCSAIAEYGEPFVCAVERAPLYGVQFHPEKSSAHGLKLLENFAGDLRRGRRRYVIGLSSTRRSTSSAARRCASRRATSSASKVYADDPLDAARRWVERGRPSGCTWSISTARARAGP